MSWVVFELAVTKLPHYVLPLYPSAAMRAGVIDTGTLSRRPWLLRGVIWQALLPLIAGALCVVALVVMGRQGGSVRLAVLMAGAVLTAFLGWRRLADRGAEQALLCGVMVAVLILCMTFSE